MPPKSIFRQPGARHFQVVHRSQRDPLIHDPEASQHVLKPIVKGKTRAELESSLVVDELAHDLSRANIGEAALYGVYYDDTDYDYMQHLRTVGVQEEGVESVLIEAPSTSKGKRAAGKTKRDGEDMLIRDIPKEALPSATEMPMDYGSQQAIPDALAGLQPDMDPHLRQTLEALEDDAFVDDGLEDDFFTELVGGGERDDENEVEFEFDEEGVEEERHEHEREEEGGAPEDEEEDSWEARFAKFKRQKEQESRMKDKDQSDADSDIALDVRSEGEDTVGNLPEIRVIGGRRRRKGTSDASGYSMSSSSMFRNEGLTLLDERFDQVEREYASDEDEEEEDEGSDEAPELITSREDFNSIMDDFLENYEILGGKMKPVLPGDSVTEKLGTIRQSLREIGYEVNDRLDDEKGTIEQDAFESIIEEKEDRWDCETILSTYSNLENHPRLIRAKEVKPVPKIVLDPKSGLPTTVVKEPKPRTKGRRSVLPVVTEEIITTPQVTITRPKNETKEEKQLRKQIVKQERQARRVEKKATKHQFSDEKKRQLQILVNTEKRGIKKL